MATKMTDKIVEIPLNKIHADFDWNSRSGDPANQGDSGGELPENEFASLVESIRSRGQDQPVIVRPKGQSFALVVGFRRYRALQVIADKDKTATIKAIVRELTDIEATSLNIRENTARKQLGPADLMVALVKLKGLYAEVKVSVTIDAMSAEVGVGRSYASKLLSIHDKVMPKFIKAWRESPVEIGVNKIEALAKLDKGEQQEREWNTNIATSEGRGAGGGRKGKAWLEGAEREAKRIGTFLGNLERLNKISTANLDFKKDIELVVQMKDGDQKATELQRAKIVKVCDEAYALALNPPPPEPKKEKLVKGAAAN